MSTVGDKIARLDAWRDRVWRDGAHSPEQKAKILSNVEDLKAELRKYDSRMKLISLDNAQESVHLTDVEKAAIRWQHVKTLYPSSFEVSLWETLSSADEGNLDKLAKAYPVEVKAIREWRHGTLAKDLRRKPLEFSI